MTSYICICLVLVPHLFSSSCVRTYHVHLHLIDSPVIFKVEEKPVCLLLLRLQQSHAYPALLIKLDRSSVPVWLYKKIKENLPRLARSHDSDAEPKQTSRVGAVKRYIRNAQRPTDRILVMVGSSNCHRCFQQLLLPH